MAKELKCGSSCFYDWFKKEKVPSKWLKLLSSIFNVDEEYLNKKVNDIVVYRPKASGFNNYKIIDDKVILYIERWRKEPIETVIDLKHFDRVRDSGYRWLSAWNKVMNKYYVRGSKLIRKDENGKSIFQYMYLHRFIMEDPLGMDGDHHDHDTLNNTELNLFTTSTLLNTKNRNAKNINNKSGFRNVFWNTKDARWLVMLQVDKRQKCFGRYKFEDLDKAGLRAEEARQEIYGEFAGRN